jgi:hypothetical protein
VTFRSSGNIPHLDPTEDSSKEDIISTPRTFYSGERVGPSTCEMSQKRKKLDVDRLILKRTQIVKRRLLQI